MSRLDTPQAVDSCDVSFATLNLEKAGMTGFLS